MKKLLFCFLTFIFLSVSAQTIKQQKTDHNQKEKVEQQSQQKKVKETTFENEKKEEPKQIWQQSKKSNSNQIIKKRKPVSFPRIQQTKKQKNPSYDQPDYEIKYKVHHHKPLKKIKNTQEIHYESPMHYHYTIHPVFIYRGLWIRYYFIHDDGYFFYNGYPYFVYHNHLHRYSTNDTGFYDLVDSITDEVYATFYGQNTKESYDRAAVVRDLLNNEEGYYRYFCSERFEYDPDYYYGWDPDDFSDWYWE